MADDIPLTPVEAQVHGQMMVDHRSHKCCRCEARHDLSDGGYVCRRGRDARKVQSHPRTCRKFSLDEDSTRWLA